MLKRLARRASALPVELGRCVRWTSDPPLPPPEPTAEQETECKVAASPSPQRSLRLNSGAPQVVPLDGGRAARLDFLTDMVPDAAWSSFAARHGLRTRRGLERAEAASQLLGANPELVPGRVGHRGASASDSGGAWRVPAAPPPAWT